MAEAKAADPVAPASPKEVLHGKLAERKTLQDEASARAAEKRAQKRHERKEFLRKKRDEMVKRYKEVFGRDFTVADLKSWQKKCKELELERFLEARFVHLSELDSELVDEILAEDLKASGRKEQ